MRAPAPPRRPTYKKPSRINAVSLLLVAVVAGLGYLFVSLWPVLTTRATIKGYLGDVLPELWRANLRDDSVARAEMARLKKLLSERIRASGVKDRKVEVLLERSKKRVSIEARFVLTADFRWLDKKVDVPCAPRVETDAARIEW
jgi:hypothetical protein